MHHGPSYEGAGGAWHSDIGAARDVGGGLHPGQRSGRRSITQWGSASWKNVYTTYNCVCKKLFYGGRALCARWSVYAIVRWEMTTEVPVEREDRRVVRPSSRSSKVWLLAAVMAAGFSLLAVCGAQGTRSSPMSNPLTTMDGNQANREVTENVLRENLGDPIARRITSRVFMI